MFEWLLKYPPDWYAGGSLGIAWPWQAYVLACAGVAVLLLWLPGYRRVRRGTGPFALRALLAAVLLLALAEPTLVVEAPGPVQGHVAVLLDDSLSMRIRDAGGESRAEQADALFGHGGRDREAGTVARALERRIETRYFRFGEGIQPLAAAEPLRHADARSELGGALAGVAGGHDAASLAAVVVVSDGGESAPPGMLDSALQTLRAAAVPVHVVALGDPRAGPDLELRALRMPRALLAGDSFEVDVEIAHRALGGRRATLVIEEDGLIADRYELLLEREHPVVSVRRRLAFDTGGSRLLTARLVELPEEYNNENNILEASLDVIGDPIRVLHVEGEPRFEVKFLRRAVAHDPAIRLTSLVRTADNKYYRSGVQEANELAQGFPADPAELFRYDVLVLGSVPAALLTPAQYTAIRDFVARRGGGLLLLGGRHAFAEGGHGATPLGELAPVVLDDGAGEFHEAVAVRLAAAGHTDPLLDFGDAEPRAARFARLPPLTVINPHRRAKAGATVLLEGRDRRGEPLILLAAQRYGLGRVISFPVRNSWRWQMHSSIPLDDQTHQTLWRQLLRDLGRGAGGRVRLTLAETQTTPGRPVLVQTQVLDVHYQPLAQAAVALKVTSPLGEIRRYPLSPAGAGRFEGQFVPGEAGRYDLAVELEEEGAAVATAREHVDVTTTGREFHTPGDARARLARIASVTGGRLLDAGSAHRLASLIDEARGVRRELQRLALWDAPILLLSLLVLACAEWALRRRSRLA